MQRYAPPRYLYAQLEVYSALAVKGSGVIKDDINLSPQASGNSIIGTVTLHLVCDRATYVWNLLIVTFTDKDGIIVGSRTWNFPASVDPDSLKREVETMTSRPYLKGGYYIPEEALKPGLLEDGN